MQGKTRAYNRHTYSSVESLESMGMEIITVDLRLLSISPNVVIMLW